MSSTFVLTGNWNNRGSAAPFCFTNSGAKIKCFDVKYSSNNGFNITLTFALMVIGKRHERFEKAINYLQKEKILDSKNVVKSISEGMGRHPNNVRSAMRGDSEYLTFKFVKTFCSVFGNVISPEWIWDGVGDMVCVENTLFQEEPEVSEETLQRLSREELIVLVKQLITLHSEQNEMYRMMIKQNEEMIRNGQSRFNDITNIIYKNVQQ